jgi:hypothetical protein
MIPVDPRAEEFRETIASGSGAVFRNARGRSFFPACGAQRGDAREFVVFAQGKDSENETTDEHR